MSFRREGLPTIAQYLWRSQFGDLQPPEGSIENGRWPTSEEMVKAGLTQNSDVRQDETVDVSEPPLVGE